MKIDSSALPDCRSTQLSLFAPACSSRTVALGELFCGAGGTALGSALAQYKGWKFEHAWATDIDKDSCCTIQQIVESQRVKRADVRHLDFQEMERKYGKIDGLVFGFPCNDFSVVGERHGIDGKYGGLYQFGVKALQDLQPIFFVAENVSGLSSTNRKTDFERILAELKDAGYIVVERLYKFEDYGIPQRRHRYIIVGFRKDTGVEFRHPLPEGYRKRTAKEALSDLPCDVKNNERTAQSQRVIERLTYIKPGENVFNATNLPNNLRLNMRSGAKISQIYRRLLPDEPSYTVTGSGGGGTHLYHWEEPRALTNRERARLQTFPDNFEFIGKKESVRRQVGMAVPPEGARIIFQTLLTFFVSYNMRN